MVAPRCYATRALTAMRALAPGIPQMDVTAVAQFIAPPLGGAGKGALMRGGRAWVLCWKEGRAQCATV